MRRRAYGALVWSARSGAFVLGIVVDSRDGETALFDPPDRAANHFDTGQRCQDNAAPKQKVVSVIAGLTHVVPPCSEVGHSPHRQIGPSMQAESGHEKNGCPGFGQTAERDWEGDAEGNKTPTVNQKTNPNFG